MNGGVAYSGSGIYADPYGAGKVRVGKVWSDYENYQPGGLAQTFNVTNKLFWCDIVANTVSDCFNYFIGCNVSFILAPEAGPGTDEMATLVSTPPYNILILSGMSGDSTVFQVAAGANLGSSNSVNTNTIGAGANLGSKVNSNSNSADASQVMKRKHSTLIGPMTPAKDYLTSAFNLFRKKGAKTVFYIHSTQMDIFGQITAGSIPGALENSFTILGNEEIDLSLVASGLNGQGEKDLIKSVLQQMINNGTVPDMLVIITYFSCDNVPQLMKELNLSPSVTILWECPGNLGQYSSEIQSDSQYLVYPSQSDSRLEGDQFSDDPTRPYANRFTSSSSATPMQQAVNAIMNYVPSLMAANNSDFMDAPNETEIATLNVYNSLYSSEFVCYYVVDYAIGEILSSLADSVGDSIKDALQVWESKSLSEQRLELANKANGVNMITFYGLLTVDRFGMNSLKPMVLLQVQSDTADTEPSIIFPDSSLATVEPIYPQPTWNERVASYPGMKSLGEKLIIAALSLHLISSTATIMALIKNRSKKEIKAASLNFTIVIVLGSMLGCAGVFTWLSNPTEIACVLRMPMLIMGFSITLWSLILKVRRIVVIFNNRSASSASLGFVFDRQMMILLTIILTSVFLLLVVPWITLVPQSPTIVVVDPLRPSLNYRECSSSNSEEDNLMMIITVCYIMVTLLLATYYSKGLSKVYAKFNESRPIQTVIGSVTLIMGLLVAFQCLQTSATRTAVMYVRSLVLLTIFSMMVFFLAAYKLSDGGWWWLSFNSSLHNSSSPANANNRSGIVYIYKGNNNNVGLATAGVTGKVVVPVVHQPHVSTERMNVDKGSNSNNSPKAVEQNYIVQMNLPSTPTSAANPLSLQTGSLASISDSPPHASRLSVVRSPRPTIAGASNTSPPRPHSIITPSSPPSIKLYSTTS